MAEREAAPTEEEIAPVLQDLLRKSDLDKTTLRLVMDNLSQHFDVSVEVLTSRKKYVRGQIEAYLENHYHPDDEAAGSSEKPKKRKRAVGGTAKLNGLEKAVILAEPLAEFLGELVLPRTHVSKRIIAYVKEHNLQDESDRRKVLCDEPLKTVFKVDHFTFFSLNKIITTLLYKEDEVQDERMKALCVECNEKTLADKQAKIDSGEVAPPKAKAAKSRSTKKLKEAGGEKRERAPGPPYKLSPPMAEVCGGEVMSRKEVLQNIWKYIKDNGLSGGGKINCDDKLKAIFDNEDSIANFGVTKYLKQHITKIE